MSTYPKNNRLAKLNIMHLLYGCGTMKTIPKFENYYATTCGKIISKTKNKEITTWLRKGNVYKLCALFKDGVRHTYRVHRVIASAYLGIDIDSSDLHVNHKDANTFNNSICNLEVVTNKENTDHGYDNNLYKSRHRVEVSVKNLVTNEVVVCKSYRKAQEVTNIDRHVISNKLKETDRIIIDQFEIEIIGFDKPYRILDEKGNDFRSALQCSKFYGFDERLFRDKVRKCKGEMEFLYKGKKFKVYYI